MADDPDPGGPFDSPLAELERLHHQLAAQADAVDGAETAEGFEAATAAGVAARARCRELTASMAADTDRIAEALGAAFPPRPDLLARLPQPAPVGPHLLLGGWDDAEDPDRLATLGVTAVINCAATHSSGAPDPRHRYPADWECVGFPAQDTELYPLLALHLRPFLEVVDRLAADGRKALVHCVAGANRSAALCVAALLHAGAPLLEAVRAVHTVRPVILSNPGFRRQLVDFARAEELRWRRRLLPTDAELADLQASAPAPAPDFDWTTYIM